MEQPIDRWTTAKHMVRIRMVEQYIAARYPEQQMRCPTHLCVGQETVPAVFGLLAKPDDVFMGTYRSHGHYLAKGGDLTALFAELLGRRQGCSKGFGGSMHLIDPARGFLGTSAIVASGVSIATGVALRFQYDHMPGVVFCFVGDGAFEEGACYESMNFAALHRLPLVIVCENNRLAIATTLEERQASPALASRFSSLGVPGTRVAAHDIDGLARAAIAAIDAARRGRGPSIIEHETVRWSSHVGPEVAPEASAWWEDPTSEAARRCPIGALLADLRSRGIVADDAVRAWHDACAEEIAAAYAAALAGPPCDAMDVDRSVYASPHTSTLPRSADTAGEFVAAAARHENTMVNPF